MRFTSLALLIVALGSTIAAGSPSKLDVPIPQHFAVLNPEGPCNFGTAVDQVAMTAGVPVGLEYTRDCSLSSRSKAAKLSAIDLTGMTARQALDHLVTLVPDYRWKELDGIAVVRPTDAWDDRENVLNRRTPPFEVTNAPLRDVLDIVLRGVTPSLYFARPDWGRAVGRAIDRPVSVVFPGGTMMEALNVVMKAESGATWELGYFKPGTTFAMIRVRSLEFSGGDFFAPIGLTRARP